MYCNYECRLFGENIFEHRASFRGVPLLAARFLARTPFSAPDIQGQSNEAQVSYCQVSQLQPAGYTLLAPASVRKYDHPAFKGHCVSY